jgi:dienelactone hydrolase
VSPAAQIGTEASVPRRLVRARHGALTIECLTAPFNTVHYRLFYPALYTGTDQERLTGELPADPELAPWPLVIMIPGVNVGSEGYRWLAERLAQAGIAALTYSLVAPVTGTEPALSPGLDLGAVRPATFGTTPSATAIGPLLDALRLEAPEHRVLSMLDLDCIALFGHSAGGTMALENARPDWFPGLRAAVSYAGHTLASTMLGFPASTVLPVGDVPALIIDGEHDNVIARSADRYRSSAGVDTGTLGDAAHDPVARTFHEGISRSEGDSFWVRVKGATHLSVQHPIDPTSARGFLELDSDVSGQNSVGSTEESCNRSEEPATRNSVGSTEESCNRSEEPATRNSVGSTEEIREFIGALIVSFLDRAMRATHADLPTSPDDAFHALLDHPLVLTVAQR